MAVAVLIPVHLYEQPADMEPLAAIAHERGIALVEDAAQAIGTEYQGKRVGGLGDIGCFSFYPTKNLGALGDGGLATTQNQGLADRLRSLRAYGGREWYLLLSDVSGTHGRAGGRGGGGVSAIGVMGEGVACTMN
ncbi:MAG TPA: DegT/DnrJ/EryC1/StrS family aminotransferase [Candidatus Methylomirabilis sp.]